jgi:two-component system chemotaxis response regulator CheY
MSELNILIADDSSSARALLESMLSPYGHCDFALDGREAVARFQAALDQGRPYDIIFMDIHMPDMDGLKAARKIKDIQSRFQGQSRTKVVMLSQIRDKETMLKSQLQIGVEMYLTKPLEKGTLQETLVNLELLDMPLDIERLCDRS